MNYKEIHQDIFTAKNFDFIAHCIASDFGMGAGIAVQFQKRFGIRSGLIEAAKYEDSSPGSCILSGNLFNLITKRKSSGKPTYDTLRSSLIAMREQLGKIPFPLDSPKIIMPKIGCGLDRLQWGKVKEMLFDIFGNDDIEITIYKWK